MKVLGIKIPIFTSDFENTVQDYERLLGQKTQNKFDVESIGISVARIHDFLIVGGSEDALKSLPRVKATLTVDSIDEYFAHLNRAGADILQPPSETPTGKNMIARYVDGNVFEFVELNAK